MSDSYRTVSVKLKQRTSAAFRVEIPRSKIGWAWIPRSLIHGGDENKLNRAELDAEITFRLMEFKADELGLAG